ncbi:MAG: DUF1800 family protein [Anaerolineae bacterium]|nr:DUF1800 family protein [Anaerolineae bacterium]
MDYTEANHFVARRRRLPSSALMPEPASQEASGDLDTHSAPPSMALHALSRLAFGPRPGDSHTSIEAFNALGTTDDVRLANWVDQQLDPAFLAQPDESDQRISASASNLPTLGLSLADLWAAHMVGSGSRTRPVADTRNVTLLRALYSRRQLYEVMVDFWHNHFSVFGWDGQYASATWVHYDRDVIRPHALGNFRQMLEAVAKSPAMPNASVACATGTRALCFPP